MGIEGKDNFSFDFTEQPKQKELRDIHESLADGFPTNVGSIDIGDFLTDYGSKVTGKQNAGQDTIFVLENGQRTPPLAKDDELNVTQK